MKNFNFPILMRSIITGVCVVTFFFNGFCQIKYNGTINTGTDASAINFQTQGTGTYSFASGYQSVASGHTSTAIGYKATAIGIRSFAIGENTYSASQGYSFGQQAKASASARMIRVHNKSGHHSCPKLNLAYIHNNPAQYGLCEVAWAYKYSSATNYAEMKSLLNVILLSL